MKTYQQTKSLECEASLINLNELVEKRKEKGEVAEKVQRNCKEVPGRSGGLTVMEVKP